MSIQIICLIQLAEVKKIFQRGEVKVRNFLNLKWWWCVLIIKANWKDRWYTKAEQKIKYRSFDHLKTCHEYNNSRSLYKTFFLNILKQQTWADGLVIWFSLRARELSEFDPSFFKPHNKLIQNINSTTFSSFGVELSDGILAKRVGARL